MSAHTKATNEFNKYMDDNVVSIVKQNWGDFDLETLETLYEYTKKQAIQLLELEKTVKSDTEKWQIAKMKKQSLQLTVQFYEDIVFLQSNGV